MKKKIAAMTIVAIFILGIMGLTGFMVLQSQGMSDKVESKISKKEITSIEVAQVKAEEEEYSDDYGITLVPIDEKITITPQGESSQSTDTETQTGETQAASGEYFFADSNTRRLAESEVKGLTAQELKIARNEIIARHGRKFASEDLKTYFGSKSWYKGEIEPEEFDQTYEQRLNEIEKANIELIKSYEK